MNIKVYVTAYECKQRLECLTCVHTADACIATYHATSIKHLVVYGAQQQQQRTCQQSSDITHMKEQLKAHA